MDTFPAGLSKKRENGVCEYKGPGDSARMSNAARTREILRTNSSSAFVIFSARSDGEIVAPEMGR